MIQPPGTSNENFQAVKALCLDYQREGGFGALVSEKFGIHPEVEAALFNPPLLSHLFEATQGSKTRLGISVQAIMAWEEHRASLLPTVARNLTSRASLAGLEAVRDVQGDLILGEVKKLAAELAEFRLGVSQEIMGLKKSSSPAGGSSDLKAMLAPVQEQVSSISKNMAEEKEARLAAQTARWNREKEHAEQKRLNAVLNEKASKAKMAKKAEEKVKRKEALDARAKRIAEIKDKKRRGENPYTPEETKEFAKRLAKKGKVYYTPEQRAAFKKGNPPKKDGKKAPAKGNAGKTPVRKFVPYTDAQKEAFRRELEKAGKRYYTKEERREYKKVQAIARKKAKSNAPSGRGLFGDVPSGLEGGGGGALGGDGFGSVA